MLVIPGTDINRLNGPVRCDNFYSIKDVRKLLAKGVVGQDAFWEISYHPAPVFSANNHLYRGKKNSTTFVTRTSQKEAKINIVSPTFQFQKLDQFYTSFQQSNWDELSEFNQI